MSREPVDVLVIAPFRRVGFRHAISPSYPQEEPWDSPPFLTAGAIRQAAATVDVLMLQNLFPGFDDTADRSTMRQLLAARRPQVVVFSSDHLIPSRSTATLYGIAVVLDELLAADIPAKAVVTGRLATTSWQRLFEELPTLDAVVVGESEAVIGDVVTRLLVGRPLDDFDCVVTRAGWHAGQVQPRPAMVDSPDDIALPAFDLAATSIELLQARRPYPDVPIPFSIRTSYGCKFRCKFCAGVPNWLEYRTKSAERVATELDQFDKLGSSVAALTFLEDEIATRSPDHVRGLTRVLKDRSIRLHGLYTHASLLTDEIAGELAPVVDRVYMGLDNPNDAILRRMGKGQRADTVLEAVATAKRNGLGAHLEWIIGSPEETVDTLATSLNAIFSLLITGVVDSINTYVYCPHPGTEYAAHATRYDMVIHEEFDMLESGGFPAAATSQLSRAQVFTAYLMSQLVIHEATSARTALGTVRHAPAARLQELSRILELAGGRQ